MRFVGVLRAEGARDERVARHVVRPCCAERAREREQHRARRERDRRARVAHDMTARIDDERLRREQRFDLVEQQQPLLAARDQARRRRVQDARGAFDFRRQRRDARLARGASGARERGARRLACAGAASRCPRRSAHARPATRRERRGVELGEHALGLVDASDQQQAPDLQIARMRGVHPVAVRFERRARGVERLRRPAEVARGERDLGLGDDASRARHGLFRTEGARRASHERLRSHEIAELRHRDAAQRERGRVVAQRDPVQRAERITRRERARRRRDQRVHGANPATLVTPTIRCPVLIYHGVASETERAAHDA